MEPTTQVELDVTDPRYGAVGDGHHNDQSAIQAALDEAADSGHRVLLPAGHTFVAGHLRIGARTTLVINATLRQATDPDSYGYGPGRGHDLPGGATLPYHLASRENLPLLLASRVRDVTVTGSGTLEMMGGTDDEVINIAPIGLYQVDGFEVSGLRIRESHSWMVMVYVCRDGVVSGLDLASDHRNSDGICLLNSQRVTVRQNRMRVADDGVYVRTEYNSRTHRRDIQWYSTRWPQNSTDILICDNDVVSRTRGFAFIPWGAGAPDQNAIEISRVVVRNNRFEAMLPISSWTDDPTNKPVFASRAAWQDTAGDYDNHVPIKDVTIRDNTCVPVGDLSISARHTEFRHLARITNLDNDLGLLSWPGTDREPTTVDELLPNGDFSYGGLAHWSCDGDVTVVTPDQLDGLSEPARAAVTELFTQPLAWGPTAHLSGASGPARIFQGLGLKQHGDQPTWYEFSLELVSGAGATVTARHADQVLASEAIPAGHHHVSLRVPIPQTMNPVQVGVDLPAGEEHWALLTKARIRHLGVDPTS